MPKSGCAPSPNQRMHAGPVYWCLRKEFQTLLCLRDIVALSWRHPCGPRAEKSWICSVWNQNKERRDGSESWILNYLPGFGMHAGRLMGSPSAAEAWCCCPSAWVRGCTSACQTYGGVVQCSILGKRSFPSCYTEIWVLYKVIVFQVRTSCILFVEGFWGFWALQLRHF